MKKDRGVQFLFLATVSTLNFVLLLMLYWSSTLVEEDLKVLQTANKQIAAQLETIQHAPFIKDLNHSASSATHTPSLADASLPNLLTPDPFYAKTLPELLGPNFKPHGTLKGAVLGKPNNLHPFTNWVNPAGWIAQCLATVSKLHFGIYETMSPDLAFKMEERYDPVTGKKEFWVHLRENIFWEPLQPEWFTEDIHLASHFFKRHPVTADDFLFYYQAMMNPHVQEAGAIAGRLYYGDIESFEVKNARTFVVRWRHEAVVQPNGTKELKTKYIAKQLTGNLRPLASFVYKYFADGRKIIEDDSATDTYLTNSVWGQNFSEHWAKNIIPSCGAWAFNGMKDRQIQFRRNANFYDPLANLINESAVQIKEATEAMWQLFKSNQLDTYALQPAQISELQEFLESPAYKAQEQEGAAIRQLEYLMRAYFYIGWNQHNSLFASKAVRQALTMSIDRQRIIRQNLNGLGIEITCPFYRNSPSYDPSIRPWPYDPVRAKALLEKEGWYDSDGDGIIDKEIDGVRIPFRFYLTFFVKYNVTKTICEYVATALKEVGIDCRLRGVDTADLSAIVDDKSFDALCLGWFLGTPPEDPKQLWYSTGSNEKGSSNVVGFANAEADALIDQLQYESDPQRRIELYHRFAAIIHEEAPYTFLYTPKTVYLYRDYLQNVFIPAERQDLVDGANIGEPDSTIFWIK